MSKKQHRDEAPAVDFRDEYPRFTPDMKYTHKLLVPDMLPVHFGIILNILRRDGWDVELLTNDARAVIDEGLKHVHNDTCFPALCVTGQFVDALKSGKYDPDRTALLITQSGGGCRASNYIPLIRKAIRAEFPNVPVVSFNFAGLEKDSGFPMDLKTILKLAYAVFYGDTLLSLYNQCKPYEREKGAADAVRDGCVRYIDEAFEKGTFRKYKKITREMLSRFAALPRTGEKKVKVGIVGEIYVKYSPLGNNDLEKFLASQDCEVNIPGLMGFVQYCVYNFSETARLYGGNVLTLNASSLLLNIIGKTEKVMIDSLKANGYHAPMPFLELVKQADGVISTGTKMGEGWLLTAEMVELVRTGYENIVCAQPFGCLPNHICGKGMMKPIKAKNPNINIVAIDYDAGATKVNQENRLKLMLANARKNRERQRAGETAVQAQAIRADLVQPAAAAVRADRDEEERSSLSFPALKNA